MYLELIVCDCKTVRALILNNHCKIYFSALSVPLLQIFYLRGPQAWTRGAGAGEVGRSGDTQDSLVVEW